MDDLRERQDNEIIVLKSIYLDDLKDLTNQHQQSERKKKQQSPAVATAAANNDFVPTVLLITLKPQSSQSQCDIDCEQYVKIDLRVKLTENYPNELPKLHLENEKGLSTDLVKTLHRLIVNKANTLIGKEMIYELCNEIREFLYSHNHPPAKSFYDQRLENKINLEKEQLESVFDEKKKCEEDLLAQIDFAVDLKRKMLQLERKKEKELEKRERLSSTNSPACSTRERSRSHQKSDSESREVFSKKKSFDDSESPDETIELIEFCPFFIEFNEPSQYYKIKCIKLIKFDKENSFTNYLGIDLKTNEMYTVYQWQINLTKNGIFEAKKLEACEIEVHKIQEEFKRLIRLNNKLLFKYLAYKCFRDKNVYTVQICLEYLEGNTLELLTNQQHSYAILDNTLQNFSVQLLEALDYLHSNYVAHRDFKLACIYLVKNSLNLKVSDYSLVKRLNDLNNIVGHDATTTFQGNQKSDIHQLGIIILSLRLGETIKTYHPQIPASFPPEVKNFMSICINENVPRQLERFDCKFLKRHPFILKNYDQNQAASSKVVEGRRRKPSNHFDDEDDEDVDCMKTFTDYPLQSRLNTEFEVIGVVGHGGFGEVLKVKNKLDSRFYAIKRIRTNPNSNKYNQQIIREIKLLSRLNHENVVRYYSTWAEKYEEVYENTERRRKRTQSQESAHSGSPKSTTHLVRFRKITENNEPDEISDLSSSSDESNDGCIHWCKRGKNQEDDYSLSMSLSNSALNDKSLSDEESSMETGEDDNQMSDNDSVEIEIETESDDDIEFAEFESNGHVDAEIQKKKPSKAVNMERRTSQQSTNFYLDKPIDDATDDSVIFENSNSALEASSKIMSINDEDSYNDYDETNENDEVKEGVNSKVNRQFIYIQMEYCGGKTLKYLIEQGLYNDEDRVWCLLREILQGLNHIHEQGMIHRDLKPGNVLIDRDGHAKLADFGLATSKFFLQKTPENHKHMGSGNADADFARQSSLNTQDSNNLTSLSNPQLDSVSLSGAVGTALYVAPELLVPFTKNKFFYTQKVDIYSLGVMFYEMCFPFSTNMERIHVIQNLRQRNIVMNDNIDKELFKKQIYLIRAMLNHDPAKRPSAKELLLNDMIPRKADEIALDALLQSSLANKQSSNYSTILKAVFDQKNSKIEDYAFDDTNLRLPPSYTYLQIREHINNTFVSIFQKYGGYLITYPLLMPWNDKCNDFNKAFKLTDSSGTVLCLPYNHRLPFARYLARTGQNNVKRYHIGPVYQVLIEKLKLTSNHPKEHVEASFDIVTSSHADCLPEIEILSIINDIMNSFPQFTTSGHELKLIVNHTSIINSILTYCGINPNQHKQIYYLLSDFNNKLIKSQDASKENRFNWFKDRLPKLDLNDQVIERLLNFLLKYGTPEKVLSELRSLTKSESQFSKLAKEGINQLKIITNNCNIIDLKITTIVSTSLVLPAVSNPYEYSGFIFQLLVQKNKKKSEFDILASGGRYDKLISYFKTKDITRQCAVGISFDFERVVSIINSKSTQGARRAELVICTIGQSQSNASLINSSSSQNLIGDASKKQKNQQEPTFSNSAINQDIRNRLRLFKQFSTLNRNLNISTSIAHEKFSTTDEMDEFCKKYAISSYVFLKEGMSSSTSQILLSNSYKNQQTVANLSTSPPPAYATPITQYLKIRSIFDKESKFTEKKLNLQDFLVQSNSVINNNSINSNSGLQMINPSLNTNLSLSSTNSYAELMAKILSTASSSSGSFPGPSNKDWTPSTTSSMSNLNNNCSTPTFNNSSNTSQINTTLLVETSSRQQSSERGGSTRKKLESQILSKMSHIFSLFSSKTRIELIALEVQDNVIQCLANGLRLDMDEQYFHSNWLHCLDKLNNPKSKKQLCNHKLDEIIHELRYVKKSKVFILYSLKSDQYKIIVVP